MQRAGSNSDLASDYQHLFKFIIIGDEAVGKTCLLLQFTDKRPSSSRASYKEPCAGIGRRTRRRAFGRAFGRSFCLQFF